MKLCCEYKCYVYEVTTQFLKSSHKLPQEVLFTIKIGKKSLKNCFSESNFFFFSKLNRAVICNLSFCHEIDKVVRKLSSELFVEIKCLIPLSVDGRHVIIMEEKRYRI